MTPRLENQPTLFAAHSRASTPRSCDLLLISCHPLSRTSLVCPFCEPSDAFLSVAARLGQRFDVGLMTVFLTSVEHVPQFRQEGVELERSCEHPFPVVVGPVSGLLHLSSPSRRLCPTPFLRYAFPPASGSAFVHLILVEVSRVDSFFPPPPRLGPSLTTSTP